MQSLKVGVGGLMVNGLNPVIVKGLRHYAKENKTIEEMLYYLIEELDLDSNSRIIIFIYFREAFGISLSNIKKIGAWEFFEGGTWHIRDVEEEIWPLIKSSLI